ncbi:hypothetical protein BC938DRAFT_478317 [Jimgerdemannia flammicorona]|uniref:Uncharacterized protein n=1 Tax=Jimgerdemannia flammicorona TaxID=994334 RepID=A0A433QN15_9FUNG|nr:hypothetical protein BC938DRAFT_478317 [Jimgerdemannia flammicorona]
MNIQRNIRKLPEMDQKFAQSNARQGRVIYQERHYNAERVENVMKFRNSLILKPSQPGSFNKTPRVGRPCLLYYSQFPRFYAMMTDQEVEKTGHSKKRDDGNDEHEEGTVKRVRIHGKSSSVAISTRKNRERPCGYRKKIGQCMDGIFRSYVVDIEYRAIEVGKQFEGFKSGRFALEALQ